MPCQDSGQAIATTNLNNYRLYLFIINLEDSETRIGRAQLAWVAALAAADHMSIQPEDKKATDPSRPLWRDFSGAALLEVSGLSAFLMAVLTNGSGIFTSQEHQLQANRTYQSRDYVNTYVSAMVGNPAALSASAQFQSPSGGFPPNTALAACVNGTGGSNGCTTGPHDLVLVDPFSPTQPSILSGAGVSDVPRYYDGAGMPCTPVSSSDANCGIQVLSQFTASCGGPPSCQQAQSISVTYTIQQAPGVRLQSTAVLQTITNASAPTVVYLPLGSSGAGAVNNIPLWATSSSLGASIVNQVGTSQIGINTTTPQGLVDVTAPSGGASVLIADSSASGNTPGISMADTSISSLNGGASFWGLNNQNGALQVSRYGNAFVQPSPMLTVAQNGWVGLGTQTPSAILDMEESGTASNPDVSNNVSIDTYSGTQAPTTNLTLMRARGTQAAPAALQAGDKLGSLTASGLTSSGYSTPAGFTAWAENSWAASPTAFLTMYGVNNNVQMTGFRVESNGQVAMGPVTGPTGTAPQAALDVLNGQLATMNGAAATWLVDPVAGIEASSDERLKTHITPIRNALDKLGRVRGVEFDWSSKGPSPGAHGIGVIAQEIQRVFPALVSRNVVTGYWGVEYSNLVGPLIEAMRELATACPADPASDDGAGTASDDPLLSTLASLEKRRDSALAHRAALLARLAVAERALPAANAREAR